MWDPREERLSPPFQQLVSDGRGKGSAGPSTTPPSRQLLPHASCPSRPWPEPVKAPPLARAVHLLGCLELHVAGGWLCARSLGIQAVYLPREQERVVSQAAAKHRAVGHVGVNFPRGVWGASGFVCTRREGSSRGRGSRPLRKGRGDARLRRLSPAHMYCSNL